MRTYRLCLLSLCLTPLAFATSLDFKVYPENGSCREISETPCISGYIVIDGNQKSEWTRTIVDTTLITPNADVRQGLHKCVDEHKIKEAFEKAFSEIKPPPIPSSFGTTTVLTNKDCDYTSPDWRGANLVITVKNTSIEQCQRMKEEFQKAFDSCNNAGTLGLGVGAIVGIVIGGFVVAAAVGIAIVLVKQN